MLAGLSSFKFKAETLLLACVFFSLNSFSQSPATGTSYQQVSALENHAHALCKEVIEKGKTTTNLTENSLATLPVGIARETPSGTFIIAIDSAYSDRGGWFFSAYASVTLPGTSHPIAFAAKNIAFSDGGLSSSTQVKLLLVSSKFVALNDNITIELPADGHNFVEWDCNGFKAINLKGNFLFSKGLLTPDPDLAKDQSQVKASFEVNTGDLQNILLSVNITPFQIRGLNDLSFEVKSATADFSDIINPAGFIFPQDYQQSYGAGITLWRGFYLQEVAIHLKDFAVDAGKDPVISARNLLIDDLGVSGFFTASNLLSLQDGSADGWPLSVDQISVKLLFSKVTGGSLAGMLTIPFLGNEPVAYTALMEQVDNRVNYKFSIATGAEKEFNTPFAAKIRIDKGSIISIEKRNGRFVPSTSLNGYLTVENAKVKTDKLRFEKLGLTTQKPYITSGIFSTVGTGQSRTLGFPIRIDSVNIRVFEGRAALGFGVSLNLMNASSKGFSATTFVQLLIKMEETTVDASPSDNPQRPRTKQEWKFDKIKVSDIELNTQGTTAISFHGKLSLFDDHPVYGSGFHGSLAFKVEKIMKNSVKVNAYFGSKETYRYWHADAYVPTVQIPIVPPLFINGFMGGASYRMIRQQPFTPDFTKLNTANVLPETSTSEVAYIPNEQTGIAFMAGVTLIGGNDKAFNADAMIEVAFNAGGGIRYAQFTGNAFFFTAVKNREKSTPGATVKAPVYASLNMLYDNDNNTFHANLKTYLNLAGVIRGTGPGGLMGEAVIHVDPKDWYFYIGRPSQMFGVDVAKLAVAQAYFIIGTQIENIPPPPSEVLEMFNKIDPNSRQDATALKGGKGFATGAHFRVGFDSKDKLKPFYIMVAVGAGADIMLRDYGDAYCAGGNGRVGIDGWYASGQAYVFLKGKVGVRTKKGREFDIVSLGAAALLQAKLPNPTWLKGQLAGGYSILGGLVKGKFNLKMIIGEECEIINPGGEIDDIQVISDLKPDVNASDVNVFTAPQVSFNTALETEFKMVDTQDNPKAYRVRLQEYTLTKNGTPIQALIEWNANKDVAILRTHEILPSQSSLKATVKVYWEKKSERGTWETIKVNGQTVYEIKETTFTTGTAPNFIPEENVAYSYPTKYQYNFHVNESGSGYVKLGMGQEYLFLPGEDGSKWTYLARFQDASRKTVDVPLTYNASQSTASFNIPTELSRQAIQKLYFIKRPVSSGAIDQNVQRTETQANAGEGNETTIASNKLEGTITQDVEKEIYSSAFRTSQFGTFQEKWSALSGAGDVFDVAKGYVAVIGKRGSLPETFDEVELKGIERKTLPLVKAIASSETPWMQNSIAPLLYNSYPVDPTVKISWRDPSVLGVTPLKGVKINNAENTVYKLTDNDITSGTAPAKSGAVSVGYFLSYYSFWDYNDLQNKAAAKYLNNWNSAPAAAKQLLGNSRYTDLLDGYYPVDITYSLPGTNQVTFRQQISIKY